MVRSNYWLVEPNAHQIVYVCSSFLSLLCGHCFRTDRGIACIAFKQVCCRLSVQDVLSSLITVIKSLSNDVKILKSLPAKRSFVRSYYSTTPVMNLFLLCVCSQIFLLQTIFNSFLS